MMEINHLNELLLTERMIYAVHACHAKERLMFRPDDEFWIYSYNFWCGKLAAVEEQLQKLNFSK